MMLSYEDTKTMEIIIASHIFELSCESEMFTGSGENNGSKKRIIFQNKNQGLRGLKDQEPQRHLK